jgi:hypothetical protein
MLDAIGPFFFSSKKEVTNWSKIPFFEIEAGNRIDPKKEKVIIKSYDAFLTRAKDMGVNAVTIDDVAHLVSFPFYPTALKKKIRSYKNLYRILFQKATQKNIKVFVNTDVCFMHPSIKKHLQREKKSVSDFFKACCEKMFAEFPQLKGVVLRIGESDGNDVEGDFKSELTLKKPEEANTFITKILPLFETHQKYCIFRTWTVGAHPIGDLCFNPQTYQKTFGTISSKYFVVSMKYGESDFYRFRDKVLSPLFFEGKHKKILELQTRREREGFGQHPFYVGWEYEQYLHQARENKRFFGISVWCQTGGWSRQQNITYGKNSTLWNELNTFATIKIFWEKLSADDAIRTFFFEKKFTHSAISQLKSATFSEEKIILMQSFLRKYRDAFLSLLYIKGFSENTFYFRRLRVPPLLWIFWDHIVISPLIHDLHKMKEGAHDFISQKEIHELNRMGKTLGMKDMAFQKDTLFVLRSARKLLCKNGTQKDIDCLREYEEKYPDSYRFTIPRESPKKLRFLRFLLLLILRENPKYRLTDKILLSSWCMKTILFISGKLFQKHMPPFVNKQCMDIKTVLVT